MYFLITEVRQACHQQSSPSQCRKALQSCGCSARADGWTERAPSSLSDCAAHSPHAALRQNGAQLNYKQIDSRIMPLSTPRSPRARMDGETRSPAHFNPGNYPAAYFYCSYRTTKDQDKQRYSGLDIHSGIWSIALVLRALKKRDHAHILTLAIGKNIMGNKKYQNIKPGVWSTVADFEHYSL